MINLDKYETIGSHWIAFYVNNDNVGASNDQHTLIALEVNIFQNKLKSL